MDELTESNRMIK